MEVHCTEKQRTKGTAEIQMKALFPNVKEDWIPTFNVVPHSDNFYIHMTHKNNDLLKGMMEHAE